MGPHERMSPGAIMYDTRLYPKRSVRNRRDQAEKGGSGFFPSFGWDVDMCSNVPETGEQCM